MAILDASPNPLNDPRTIRGWAMFDWANSAFALVITVAIFPGYFASVTDDVVNILGFEISNSNLYSFSIAGAYLLIAAFSPWLSGIADFGGRKMYFMKFFTTLGAAGCLSLLFFKDMASLWIGTIGFILAMIGFAGGLVFYNSYLPEIASEDQYDRVSAKGFAYGYVGSVILLVINLVMILKPDVFGLPDKEYLPARIAFVMVGVWWIGFAQIPFRVLPPDVKEDQKLRSLGKKGWQEIKKVWAAVKTQTQVKRFLFSFFFYSMGVQTILYLASIFGEKELEFSTSELIILVLLLQLVAIGGAYFFAWASERKGNKFSLVAMLIIWTIICLAAYIVETKIQFYAVGVFVGLVMGGIQSLSRSTYSKLIPENTSDTTSYFSFYDVLEKVAIAFGAFLFGLAELVTGDIRNSVLLLGMFFVISLFLLKPLKVERA